MKIIEKFVSIQGDGKFQGYPTAFIRCQGCNLRCNWCDSLYARNEQGEEVATDLLAMWLKETGIKNVCITGGEPMLQVGAVWTLIDQLDDKYSVCIETNGAVEVYDYYEEEFDCEVQIVMDWKMPSSGQYDDVYSMTLKNLQYLREGDEVKFVIAGWDDYTEAKACMERVRDHGVGILFSPLQKRVVKIANGPDVIHKGLEPAKLAKWMIEDKLSDVRLNLQLHKILWPDVLRGV